MDGVSIISILSFFFFWVSFIGVNQQTLRKVHHRECKEQIKSNIASGSKKFAAAMKTKQEYIFVFRLNYIYYQHLFLGWNKENFGIFKFYQMSNFVHSLIWRKKIKPVLQRELMPLELHIWSNGPTWFCSNYKTMPSPAVVRPVSKVQKFTCPSL